MDDTRALLERLDTDKNLRRICGWESKGFIPSESTFSRAFAEFADSGLPGKVHNALIKNTVGNEIVSHNSRDSTSIYGWEGRHPKKFKMETEKRSKKKEPFSKKEKRADLKREKKRQRRNQLV